MSIDMSKSGWDNPEGFIPRERDVAPPPEPACEAQGPDGWVCDLKPGHKGTDHKADGGPSWPRRASEGVAVILGEGGPEVVTDGADWTPWKDATAAKGVLKDIHTIAQYALDDPSPANWAVTLSKIVEMTRGY